jgi:proteasome beta subunit
MKQMYRRGLTEAQALRIALEALYNASEEDVGTGGPDLIRGIYPTMKVITDAGIRDMEESKIAEGCSALIAERRERV